MEAFLGSWKMETSEGFDEVMQRLGVGFLLRKAGNAMKPVVTITRSGDDTYSMKTASTFKTTEFSFKIGEPFEETTPDGRVVKSTITMDQNVMNQIQVSDKTTYITREIEADLMKTTVKVEELTSLRNYRRQ